jgi:hypothetical protein
LFNISQISCQNVALVALVFDTIFPNFEISRNLVTLEAASPFSRNGEADFYSIGFFVDNLLRKTFSTLYNLKMQPKKRQKKKNQTKKNHLGTNATLFCICF